MAPVPTHVIIWGFVIGGVGRSILVGALVTIISLFLCHCTLFLADGHHDFIDDSDSLFFSWFVKWYFAQSHDDVSIVPTFVLQPLTYLGGFSMPFPCCRHFGKLSQKLIRLFT